MCSRKVAHLLDELPAHAGVAAGLEVDVDKDGTADPRLEHAHQREGVEQRKRLGLGVDILSACDIRYAAESAEFSIKVSIQRGFTSLVWRGLDVRP